MHTALRLSACAAALMLLFGGAWTVGVSGRAPTGGVGPAAVTRDGVPEPVPVDADAGLGVSAAGYTLVPRRTAFVAGREAEFAFTVTGAAGRAVSEERLLLAVVRRDTSGFQRLNPRPGPDGVWSTSLVLPAAGTYRAFVRFTPPDGPAVTLGTDLLVPGDLVPVALPPARVAQVDGYQVRLDGALVPGGSSQVFATISRAGAAVTDLEPHLGGFGHVVALRRSDLSYVPVRPGDGRRTAGPGPDERSGPGIAFTTVVPSAGSYRLFLEFAHEGTVHTAGFTVSTAAS